jgi:hypothetical protein
MHLIDFMQLTNQPLPEYDWGDKPLGFNLFFKTEFGWKATSLASENRRFQTTMSVSSKGGFDE